MNTEISVISRAVETKIDAKRNRGPCGIFLATVEADLQGKNDQYLKECTDGSEADGSCRRITLLAGFDFSFLKMSCDWVLVARLMMAGPGVWRSLKRSLRRAIRPQVNVVLDSCERGLSDKGKHWKKLEVVVGAEVGFRKG